MSSPPAIDALGQGAPDYRFGFQPYPHRLRATFAGEVVVDSDSAIEFTETRLPPVYYFPRRDVRMDLMHASAHRTHCPFKGNASYWTLRVGERSVENLMWSYEDPLADVAGIKGYVAFYENMLDEWFEDGRPRSRGEGRQQPQAGNPLLPWLLTEAPHHDSAVALTEGLTAAMLETGIPLWRFNLVVRTLHPQLMGVAYRWWAKSAQVEEIFIPFEMMQRPQYLTSPLVPIIEGAGGIRRRLDVPEAQFDFPILRDLHGEGATDYVAMPMIFSDQQINVISLASARRGGFSTSDLGHVYEILPVLGRLYEVHALRYRATTLLDTYLGRHAGQRVLDGLIKRGDGENIEAVIWFCDLRESTPLAESMPRASFLTLLNRYFDCMAGTVLQHGGQVLRFIGDAALAIFPIAPEGMSQHEARTTAIDAAIAACAQMARINQERRESGDAELGYGIALHQGEVTYGNIGTENRLEFTVIGDAANCAARMESLCKVLGRSVLASAPVTAAAPEHFEAVGHHSLRGVEGEVELFALRGS